MHKKLGIMGILLGVALAIGSASGADGTTKPGVQATQEMEARRVRSYTDAMNATNSAAHYAEQQVAAGKKEYAMVAQACGDCADMAAVAAKFTARRSPHAGMASEMLAKCCDATVKECEKLGDSALTACMEACKKAAIDCREMK